MDRKPFGRKLCSDVFSDINNNREYAGFVSDDEAEVLNALGKSFAGADAGSDDSSLGSFGALIDIVNPRFRYHKRKKGTVHVEEDTL